MKTLIISVATLILGWIAGYNVSHYEVRSENRRLETRLELARESQAKQTIASVQYRDLAQECYQELNEFRLKEAGEPTVTIAITDDPVVWYWYDFKTGEMCSEDGKTWYPAEDGVCKPR